MQYTARKAGRLSASALILAGVAALVLALLPSGQATADHQGNSPDQGWLTLYFDANDPDDSVTVSSSSPSGQGEGDQAGWEVTVGGQEFHISCSESDDHFIGRTLTEGDHADKTVVGYEIWRTVHGELHSGGQCSTSVPTGDDPEPTDPTVGFQDTCDGEIIVTVSPNDFEGDWRVIDGEDGIHTDFDTENGDLTMTVTTESLTVENEVEEDKWEEFATHTWSEPDDCDPTPTSNGGGGGGSSEEEEDPVVLGQQIEEPEVLGETLARTGVSTPLLLLFGLGLMGAGAETLRRQSLRTTS